MVGVIAAIRRRQLNKRLLIRRCSSQRYAAAESSVAMGRRANSALNLNRAQQRAVRIHIGPEHRLVLRRVQRHAIERNIDTASCRTADAHVGRPRAQAVLSPGQYTRRIGEKQRQFAPRV